MFIRRFQGGTSLKLAVAMVPWLASQAPTPAAGSSSSALTAGRGSVSSTVPYMAGPGSPMVGMLSPGAAGAASPMGRGPEVIDGVSIESVSALTAVALCQ